MRSLTFVRGVMCSCVGVMYVCDVGGLGVRVVDAMHACMHACMHAFILNA